MTNPPFLSFMLKKGGAGATYSLLPLFLSRISLIDFSFSAVSRVICLLFLTPDGWPGISPGHQSYKTFFDLLLCWARTYTAGCVGSTVFLFTTRFSVRTCSYRASRHLLCWSTSEAVGRRLLIIVVLTCRTKPAPCSCLSSEVILAFYSQRRDIYLYEQLKWKTSYQNEQVKMLSFRSLGSAADTANPFHS